MTYTAGFKAVDPPLLGVNPANTTTAATDHSYAEYELGSRVAGYDSSGNYKIYRYVRFTGTSAYTAGKVYFIDEDWYCTAAVDTDNLTDGSDEGEGTVGVPDATVSAPGASTYVFGWIQTGGLFDAVNLLASCAANVPLYISATAGSLDDAPVDTLEYQVVNLRNTGAAVGTGAAADKECYSACEIHLVKDEPTS